MCNAVAIWVGSGKIEENNCSDETNPNIIMTDSNIESITSLDLGKNDITKITGIEYFTNLTELYLYDNRITDLTPLSNLTSLTSLYLYGNQISDISPLSGLTNLRYLGLTYNPMNDITPILSLDLEIDGSGLIGGNVSTATTNSEIYELPSLFLLLNNTLDLPEDVASWVTTITEQYVPLIEWEFQNAEMNEDGKSITIQNVNDPATIGAYVDVSGKERTLIAQVTVNNTTTIPFEEVNMCNAVATDYNVSSKIEENNCSNETSPNIIMTDSNIESVTRLYLGNKNISKISGIEYFTSLTNLNLYDNQITDLTPLKDLTSLTGLDLENNQITDITPLKDLTSLIRLDLQNNQITDLAPLKDLTSLTNLNLYDNQITDLTPLKDLTSLTNLELYNNQITDLTPLSNLTSLTNLELYNNQITDLTPLKDLTSLTYLYLENNQITDLTPLSSLTNLERLNITNNPLLDIAPILHLNLNGAPFFEGDLPLVVSFDIANNKEYILPSIFQFFNATLDVTSVASWVAEDQEQMREWKSMGVIKFEPQNAVMNEDGKSITILDTTRPAIISVYVYDDPEGESELALQLTVTYEEPVGPVDPVDPTDPAVPNTGKNAKNNNNVVLSIFSCIAPAAVMMWFVVRHFSRREK